MGHDRQHDARTADALESIAASLELIADVAAGRFATDAPRKPDPAVIAAILENPDGSGAEIDARAAELRAAGNLEDTSAPA